MLFQQLLQILVGLWCFLFWERRDDVLSSLIVVITFMQGLGY